MNLRDAIMAQTIEYFKIPKGTEVSKELMAKYMLTTDVNEFAEKFSHINLCTSCKATVSECDDAQGEEVHKCGRGIIKCNKYKS